MPNIFLTPAECELLRAALDSHQYWQLADQKYRDNGFVHEPGSDDPDDAAAIVECDELAEKLADREREP